MEGCNVLNNCVVLIMVWLTFGTWALPMTVTRQSLFGDSPTAAELPPKGDKIGPFYNAIQVGGGQYILFPAKLLVRVVACWEAGFICFILASLNALQL